VTFKRIDPSSNNLDQTDITQGSVDNTVLNLPPETDINKN